MRSNPLSQFLASMVAWMVASVVGWGFNTYVDPTNPMPFQVAFVISAVVVLIASIIIQRRPQLVGISVQPAPRNEIGAGEPPQLQAPDIITPVQSHRGRAGD